MPNFTPKVDRRAVVEIRAARPEDATRLTEIALAAKRHWGYPERWMEIWREELTVRPEFIAGDGNETYSAVVGGQHVAFYSLSMNWKNILVRKVLPHPGPLPLGGGESSADRLLRRTVISVQGFNARFFRGNLARKMEKLHLLHLWVLPDWMGRGIGRSLFQHALERTKALGFRQMEVESDPNAEGFYQRMGAHRVGVNIHTVVRQRRELPVLICEVR